MELARPRLDAMGVIPAGRLPGAETDGRVFVGGVVTHRQRPESAKGTVFLNLEDETGMVNVICSPGAWERWRPVARGSPALLVRGRLERVDGVVSVVAEKIVPPRPRPGPPAGLPGLPMTGGREVGEPLRNPSRRRRFAPMQPPGVPRNPWGTEGPSPDEGRDDEVAKNEELSRPAGRAP